jgi:hypothetical protein
MTFSRKLLPDFNLGITCLRRVLSLTSLKPQSEHKTGPE